MSEHITFQNHSTVVNSADFTAMVLAVKDQLAHHVAPAWDRHVPTVSTSATVAPTSDLIAIFDDADVAGAEGYHDETPGGRPYGKVFAKTILDGGGTIRTGAMSVSGCLSHEAIELFLDRNVEEWADDGGANLIAWEGCDPCQDGFYVLDGVAVSDFVLPAYFDPQGHRPLTHLDSIASPHGVAPGGYLIVRTGGRVTQRFGDVPPAPWRAAHKAHPAARTYRRGVR